MAKTITLKEQFAKCQEETAALKEELSQYKNAALSDRSLLNRGLTLTMENEALRKKISKDHPAQ